MQSLTATESRPDALADVPGICDLPLTRAVVQYRDVHELHHPGGRIRDIGLAVVMAGRFASSARAVDLGSAEVKYLNLTTELVILDWVYDPTLAHLRALSDAREQPSRGEQLRRYCFDLALRVLDRRGFTPLTRPILLRIGFRDLCKDLDLHEDTVVRIVAEKMEEDAVGVATGMFYTPVGGDIMLVETRVLKGKEGLVLTGQLGDVMKESAQAALTFARSHANGLDLTEERLRDHEIHIHVPAGAIPKEGPSAGIAMAVALVSALGDHPVRHDVAMTGEITLSGRVLPIGGVKEKVLGAARAGINEIILPAINEGDLEDLPDHVCEQLEFHLVETLDEALAAALANGSLEGGALAFAE